MWLGRGGVGGWVVSGPGEAGGRTLPGTRPLTRPLTRTLLCGRRRVGVGGIRRSGGGRRRPHLAHLVHLQARHQHLLAGRVQAGRQEGERLEERLEHLATVFLLGDSQQDRTRVVLAQGQLAGG